MDLYKLPFVKYIPSPTNIGYGAGHNIVLSNLINSSDFHFIFNPDIYFEPDAIQQMIERMQQDESIGQLMPKVIYPDGRLQYLCKLIPTPMDLLVRRFFLGPLKVIAERQAGKFELRFTGYSREMDVPYLSGCFMLFRTSALKKVGLFDERFFMYKEDCDLAYRLYLAGLKTVIVPEALIYHDRSSGSGKQNVFKKITNRFRISRQIRAWSLQNQNILYYKYWKNQNFVNKFLIIFWFLSSLVFSLILEQFNLKTYFKKL